jgi:signal transduction histidine kinase
VRTLDNTVAIYRSRARDKSASIVIETEPDLPLVRGFAGELSQIWSNLIENALDVIPESGRIEVYARRGPRGVLVSVIDNGSGIPDAIRERIFEPFFTTKDVGKGTGQGLDIVRRLVQHNDGEISFESRPGRTEFRVALPVAERGAGVRS